MCKIDVKSSCALPAQFIQEFTNFIESQRAKGIGIELGIETSLNPKVHATSASIDPVSYKHIPGSTCFYFIDTTWLLFIMNIQLSTTGYSSGDHPHINGSQQHPPCPHCLCGPCIVQQPPDFLTGNAAPHVGNNRRRYRLYKLFWGLLDHLGFWQHPAYLFRKQGFTTRHDVREVMPLCIRTVSAIARTVHSNHIIPF